MDCIRKLICWFRGHRYEPIKYTQSWYQRPEGEPEWQHVSESVVLNTCRRCGAWAPGERVTFTLNPPADGEICGGYLVTDRSG